MLPVICLGLKFEACYFFWVDRKYPQMGIPVRIYAVCSLGYSTFIRRRQRSGLYRRLLGPVSDHVLINRVSKERALHQVIKYSHGAI